MEQRLKVLLVDDEPICLETIKTSLNPFSYVDVVGEFLNGNDVVKFLQKNEVDLIFLDIEIKDINGFELANYINSYYPNTMIIFLTGYSDFALKGYEFQPIDFLIKPVNMVRLEQALSKVKDLKCSNKLKKEIKIGIRVEGGFEIININDISYIEKRGRKVFIICKDDKIYNSSDSLRELEDIFSEYGFFRCHQSFLVPFEKIKGIHASNFGRSYLIKLEDINAEVPLSRDKYNELKELLLERGLTFH